MTKPAVSATPSDADLTKGMEHLRPYVSVAQSKSNAVQIAPGDRDEEDVYGVPATSINPLRRPTVERVEQSSNPQKRVDPFTFGSRVLTSEDDIFEFNAWDNVEVDEAFASFAELQYAAQRENPVSDFDKSKYNATPEKWWDRFYKNNTSNFFKDRKWLFQEFPVLTEAIAEDSPPVRILEIGAGAGNTAFPILKDNKNPALRIHACDYAPSAVNVMRSSPAYDDKYIQADVWDVAGVSEDGGVSLPPDVGCGTVDIVILIFIFSALAPSQWTQALQNIDAVLKPGGQILFRDYGRGDLAQVRLKKGRYLDENFYIRGDGTRVYFFEKEELESLFGLGNQAATAEDPAENLAERPRFQIRNLAVDRRMLINRKRKLKMYRTWMQGHFVKAI